MATDRDVHVLVLGDESPVEMRPIRDAVRQVVPLDFLDFARDVVVATSMASHRDEWFPDLIVVFQNWPDEFTGVDVRDLLTTFPLSRLACCYGPWCESDGRSRNIWPTGSRIPVSQAARRIQHECNSLRSGRTGDLLPFTASRDEVFEFEYALPTPRRMSKPKLTVAVDSLDSSLRRMLAAGCADTGWQVDPERNAGHSRLVLWDADPWSPTRRQSLVELRDRSPDASVVAVAGLPSADLVDEILAAGADRVVPKLAPLEQLVAVIDELVVECQHAATPRPG
ncbi:MAG: hypothetical protein HZA46_13980 [Planctomycetales bacterium]|nr:hypothetical protein [Planctomycetales bacterium]